MVAAHPLAVLLMDGRTQIIGQGFIDDMRLEADVSRGGRILTVQRTYAQVEAAITAQQRRLAAKALLPAWVQFAQARQGSE